MEHKYLTTIEWTGNNGSGTSGYTSYERSHRIQVAGKAGIEASSDPHFRGDDKKYNPEDLFLASIASCHMLWYLHLCADHGIIVQTYLDKASGLMETGTDGSGQFSKIVLMPSITVQNEGMIDMAVKLHHKAHEMCFLANSVNFEITVQPLVKHI
jgi:organic hydroperoxide reductase OsmC/OhrA